MKIVEIQNKAQWIRDETDKFSERGKLSYKVLNELTSMIEAIETAPKHIEFYKRQGVDTGNFEEALKVCQEEILPLAKHLSQYRPFQESDIHFYMSDLTNPYNDSDNLYFKFKDLVCMINAYWDITGEKPANRIAWGWEKCREKDNPRAYLYGCIRNYLKRNGKFNKDEFNGIWSGRLL